MVERVASKGYVRSSNLVMLKRSTTMSANAQTGTATISESAVAALTGDPSALIQEFDARAEQIQRARMKGYEGDCCPECGNYTLLRNGTCMKCDTCGSTTGCS
jgi:ribonucleoside-diphosphate reductase alpha chain